MNIQHVIQGGLRLGRLMLGKSGQRAAFKYLVQTRLPDISTAGSAFAVASHAGKITKITSVINGAIATANGALTFEINGTAITGGAITVTQSGSAAGDVDSSIPTALNTVAVGDTLEVITSGAPTNTVTADITFEIDPSA